MCEPGGREGRMYAAKNGEERLIYGGSCRQDLLDNSPFHWGTGGDIGAAYTSVA